jgi:hypothetical protein
VAFTLAASTGTARVHLVVRSRIKPPQCDLYDVGLWLKPLSPVPRTPAQSKWETYMPQAIRLVVSFMTTVSVLAAYGADGVLSLSSPCPGAFQKSNWSERQIGRIRYSFQLCDGVVMPFRQWLVFTVSEARESEDATELVSRIVAVGAFQVSSGRMRQLTIPPPGVQHESTMVFAGDPMVPMGRNCCGVVLREGVPTIRIPVGKAGNVSAREQNCDERHGNDVQRAGATSCSLWKWELDDNVVHHVGPWNDEMTRVASAIGLEQVQIAWRCDTRDPMQGEFCVTDQRSKNTTSVRLQTSSRASLYNSQTFTATADPHAFVVCDAWATDKLAVFCVDPNQPGGLRWKWHKDDLEARVGLGIQGAAFLSKTSFPTQRALLLVDVIRDNRASTQLFVLDPAEGKIVKQCRLPGDYIWMSLPDTGAISPDARRLAFTVLKSPQTLDTRLIVADLDSGSTRESGNLTEVIEGIAGIWGFVNDTQMIVSDASRIWLLDTSGDLKLKELFCLTERDPQARP